MYDLEDIQFQLEQTNNLLVLTREFFEEGMPTKEDKERNWKLEVLCTRQDLIYTLIDTVSDKLNDMIILTQEMLTKELNK